MLNKSTRKLLADIIAKSFDKFKGSFVGPSASSTGYLFALSAHPTNKRVSDAYVHANASSSLRDTIDRSTIERIEATAANYVDALKQKAVSDILRTVEENLAEAKNKGMLKGVSPQMFLRSEDGREIMDKIRDQLMDQKKKIDRGIELIANVELHNAQNHGVADAILGMAKSIGDADPTVAKFGVVDDKLCKDCKRLWHTEENIKVPKVYKMSELAGDSGDWKSRVASVSSTHPACRHVLTYISKGFGFDKAGRLRYVGKDHDEHKSQGGA
jgi:hypothetical protein